MISWFLESIFKYLKILCMVFKGVSPQALNGGCWIWVLAATTLTLSLSFPLMRNRTFTPKSALARTGNVSLCSLMPESIHIPWISPCFTKAHDYSWILHSKFQVLDTTSSISGHQHFFFLSLAFWGFWDTRPIDYVCFALNFKKRYRQIFRGVVFRCLHICGHFLPENLPLLKTTFLNLMNSPSTSRIAGAVQTNSKLYDNVSLLM